MPEGHTLRRLADDLTAAFAGHRVRVSSPQGRFAADAEVLDGETLVRADSAGKHLFVEFPGDRFIHIHLGLIGKLDLLPAPAPVPVGQVRLRLQDDTTYADLRGAIQCDLVGRERVETVIASLGPDPLRPDADPATAWARVRRSQRPIGDLLLDQTVIAGVGNVYRAEVLFRHRMHPLRPGRTLRVGQFRSIWEDLVGLMHEGVRTGRIDTVHSQHTPEAMGRPPRVDDHGGEVYVYRRTGQPCLVCGSKVRTSELAGRNLFWCPQCQPVFRSRAVR
ncbi:MAG: DNA-formamidopyrimidine glycosylase family protein [Marmoricola sp.]